MSDVMPEPQGVDLDELVGDECAGTDELDAVDEQLIARLAGRARAGGLQLTGEGGLLAQLTKRLVESALEGEITDHLGYDRHDAAGRDGGNSRNGHRAKTVLTEVGPVQVDVPRDHDATFEPKIVAKRQRRLSGVDELVISLSAKGLTTTSIPIGTEVKRARVPGSRVGGSRRRAGGSRAGSGRRRSGAPRRPSRLSARNTAARTGPTPGICWIAT